MKIQPYLFFQGRCEEALNFYKTIFDAEQTTLMRYRESPEPTAMPLPPGWEEKVMRAELRIGAILFMASDGAGSEAPRPGLKPSREGWRVRYDGERHTVIDGPFAGTKELIAGYTLIQVRSREEAMEWVHRFPNPAVDGGKAEIEAKEMIAGFFLIDCTDRGEAIAIAERCPATRFATVEVRKCAPCRGLTAVHYSCGGKDHAHYRWATDTHFTQKPKAGHRRLYVWPQLPGPRRAHLGSIMPGRTMIASPHRSTPNWRLARRAPRPGRGGIHRASGCRTA
jgi:hypothetical protein